VIKKDETATVSPDVIERVFSIMSAALVPQVPCARHVPPPSVELHRKCPAVPVLSAFVSLVIAFAVAVMIPVDPPSTDAAKAVAPNWGAASWVPTSDAPQLDGRDPVQMLMKYEFSVAVIASRPVFAVAGLIMGVAVML
jgi:hypothetical protein